MCGEILLKIASFIFTFLLLASNTHAQTSTCYGTTSAGRLEGGVRIPSEGKNFRAYSDVGVLAGRTYVHSKVQAIVVNAYAALEKTAPKKIFVYGETGWENGGRFRPHKTHQNGLSVDFMVPVTKYGVSVPLPTSALNKFGYAIEFDDRGHAVVDGKTYAIDFEALAQHLVEIHKAAQASGVTIWRVIFDVPLQRLLFATALISSNTSLSPPSPPGSATTSTITSTSPFRVCPSAIGNASVATSFFRSKRRTT